MKKSTLLFVLSFFFILNLTYMPTEAQEKPIEQKKAEEEAAIAEARKRKAEAERDEAKAKKDAAALNDPVSDKDRVLLEKEKAVAEKERILANREIYKGPEVTIKDGKITSAGDFIETRVLARKTLRQAFEKIVTQMKVKDKFKKATFVIYNQSDFPAMELYASMMDQLDLLKLQIEKANQNGINAIDKPNDYKTDDFTMGDPLLAGYAASGILRTAADIVSLFKTSTDYKTTDIAFDATTIAGALKNAGDDDWSIFDPATYPVNTIKRSGATSDFLQKLNEIEQAAIAAASTYTKLESKIKGINDVITAEKLKNPKDEAKIKRLEKHVVLLTPVLNNIKTLQNSFDQLQTTLSTVDATTKLSPQAVLLKSERLMSKLNQDKVYVIKMTASSKGTNKVTENIWRSSTIEFSGGTELNVLIYASNGEIIYSDFVTEYTQFMPSDKIKPNNK
jgi:hypothetical protein